MSTDIKALRDKLAADVEAKHAAALAAKAELDAAIAKLKKFDEFAKEFEGVAPEAAPVAKKGPKPKAAKAAAKAPKGKPGPKPKGKPGPKPKAAKAAAKAPKAAVKAPKGKPGPKPKAAKAAAKGKKQGKSKGSDNRRAADGRKAVAAGLRPPIKEAISQVMGDKVMNATEIFEALKPKNWLPNANDPRGYIAYVLSSSKDHFERVQSKGRGFYKVRGVVTKAAAKAAPAPAPTAPDSNGKGKKAEKAAPGKTADAILAEAGVGSGVFGE